MIIFIAGQGQFRLHVLMNVFMWLKNSIFILSLIPFQINTQCHLAVINLQRADSCSLKEISVADDWLTCCNYLCLAV